MKRSRLYSIIILLSFIIYGNTLFHDYALDDAIVITGNEFTLSGLDGIPGLFTEEMFDGFFEQKDKKLVSGGRYRPLSVATFALEWQLFIGTPFDGLDKKSIEKRMNVNAKQKFILPSQKLLKDLSNTIHIENRSIRNKEQELILSRLSVLTSQEKNTILSNLNKMTRNRSKALFVSHFVNVLLFALTCLVLLLLLGKMFKPEGEKIWYQSLPFLVTLIFLVHPIHTEVVANIKGRDEILSLLGALLAMLYSFKYIESKRIFHLFLIFIFFLMGLFSKEVAVTFLVILPLAIYFFSDDKFRLQKGIIILIPMLIASGIYFYIRHKVIGDVSFEPSPELMNNSFLGMSFSEKYATVFYTLLLYLKLLVFPHPLTYDYYPYHIPAMHWSDIWPVISVLVYVAMGIYAFIGIKKKNMVSFGILFYLIALSPMSNIFFPIGVFMNERFVYAASIGIILIMAYFLQRIINPKISLYILLIILSLYSLKTMSRNTVWKNDFTLFTNDVKISGNSAKSNTSAGGKLIEEAVKPENKTHKTEYLNQAIYYLRRAIKIHPAYNDALLLMGNAQWELYHNPDSMMVYYSQILKKNPMFPQVYTNIFESQVFSVFEDGQRAQKNIEILHTLESFNPNNFKTNYYLGRIYGRYLNNLEKSKYYLEKAAKIDPLSDVVYKDLGVVYGITREYQKSAQAFAKAFELDSGDPVLALNLAMTYANLKDLKNAFHYMDKILEMDLQKKDANVLINLGSMYNQLGKPEKAKQCFNKAGLLNPDLLKR